MSKKRSLAPQHILGYAMGDLGGCMTFALLGSFLTPYYTEVAGLSAGAVAAMYLILKIWDAINDPLMGMLLDRAFAKADGAHGKFRPWMRRATPLLAISAVLMWIAPTYVDGAAKLLLAYVTYLLYEASYTMFNIPYGSLLSAMAHSDKDRASLSSARGFGSMIGNLFPALIFPYILKMCHDQPQLGYSIGIIICAAIGFFCCMVSCKWTEEFHYHTPVVNHRNETAIRITDIIVVLRHNRAFVALCLQGLFFCIAQYINSTLTVYMYRDVLGDLTYLSMATIISMPMSFFFLARAPKFAEKYGLERSVRVSQLISVVLYILVFSVLLFIENAMVYMLLMGFAQAVAGLTVYMQWGMLAETVDYNEYLTGKRTEGSMYGFFNLTRRIGQAIGSAAAVALLSVVGYIPNAAEQSAQTHLGIKALVLLAPALFMVLCWIILRFVWNITPAVREKMTGKS
ncbi:MAG: MFS transporter [Clostridia bacterium]|nr:MFS transporter [Clostridia bacterium]